MTRTSAILLACMLGTACSNAETGAEDAYRRGVAALEGGQPRTARIEFLNAITAKPNSAAARIMQARTYLALGDGVAAEAELDRARALRVRASETRHLLAHSLLLQNQPQEALDQLNGSIAPEHAAYAARLRGRALTMLGRTDDASTALDEAMALDPGNSLAWTEIARFRRKNGELAGALAAADKAVSLNPADIEAITLRGELTRSQYGLRAALPWFDRALEIDEDNVPALLERAITLGDLGQMTDMLAATRKVLSLHPGDPMAYYLQTVLAARAGKFDLARSLYERTQGRLENQPAVLLLAGAIDYRTGNLERAIKRLSRLLAMQPDNRKARRLLASAQWRQGDAAATVATLRPIADRADADSYALTLIGRAFQKLGDASSAAAYLSRAASPGQRAATDLFARAVGAGELDALRQRVAAKPADAAPRIALVRALLAAGFGGEALEQAQFLQRAHPGVPDAHLLVGDALGIQGQFGAAAEEYRKAANMAFTEPTAMRMIEALQRSGQDRAAGRVLQLFLDQNPRNVAALLLAGGRFMQARQYTEAIPIYEGLRRRIGDRDAAILNNLAWAYGERGDYARALPLARKAWSLDRDNPATADTLGWLLFKSGKSRVQGLVLLEQAARGAPSDAQIRAHLDSARGG